MAHPVPSVPKSGRLVMVPDGPVSCSQDLGRFLEYLVEPLRDVPVEHLGLVVVEYPVGLLLGHHQLVLPLRRPLVVWLGREYLGAEELTRLRHRGPLAEEAPLLLAHPEYADVLDHVDVEGLFRDRDLAPDPQGPPYDVVVYYHLLVRQDCRAVEQAGAVADFLPEHRSGHRQPA